MNMSTVGSDAGSYTKLNKIMYWVV